MVVLRIRPNGLPNTRFGFAVGKRLGKAVIRNRTKRRLREILRQADIVPGFDVVVIARAPAVSASYGDLKEGLIQVLQRARLLAPAGAG